MNMTNDTSLPFPAANNALTFQAQIDKIKPEKIFSVKLSVAGKGKKLKWNWQNLSSWKIRLKM